MRVLQGCDARDDLLIAQPMLWWTKANASSVPQMSSPAPLTVNVPAEADALPAAPTLPMSINAHGAGSCVLAALTVMLTGVACPGVTRVGRNSG